MSTNLSNDASGAPGAVPPARIPPALLIGVGTVLLALGAGAAGLALQNSGAPLAEAVVANAEPASRQQPTAPVKAITPPPAAAREAKPVQRVARAAPVCANCGVVESVQAVKIKGEGTGVGAVAGGVVGGVVGNQIGGGNGRKAMTVLGVVGGGVAGHEIEKHARATTVYSVKLRMDDGSLRTLQQPQAPAVGTRVRVEGSTLRAV